MIKPETTKPFLTDNEQERVETGKHAESNCHTGLGNWDEFFMSNERPTDDFMQDRQDLPVQERDKNHSAF